MVFRNILISALVIVDILTIVRVTSYFCISDTYGVDAFNTTSQLKIQLKEINEGVLCHNKFLAQRTLTIISTAKVLALSP